jgi:hypothetical protein
MGLALNELVSIKYLSKWDVQQMSSKAGYKVVMVPGEELLSILNQSRSKRREGPGMGAHRPALAEPEVSRVSPQAKQAIDALKEYGVLPAKAALLAITFCYAVALIVFVNKDGTTFLRRIGLTERTSRSSIWNDVLQADTGSAIAGRTSRWTECSRDSSVLLRHSRRVFHFPQQRPMDRRRRGDRANSRSWHPLDERGKDYLN